MWSGKEEETDGWVNNNKTAGGKLILVCCPKESSIKSLTITENLTMHLMFNFITEKAVILHNLTN